MGCYHKYKKIQNIIGREKKKITRKRREQDGEPLQKKKGTNRREHEGMRLIKNEKEGNK